MSASRIKETVDHCLGLMEAAAITAPKGLGQDSLNTAVLTDDQREMVARKMMEIGERPGKENFMRDGKNILQSQGVLLIGAKHHEPLGADCMACGQGCGDFSISVSGAFDGPNCVFKLLDLGIALGSAAKTASVLNMDSRVMFRPGVVAKQLGLIEGTVVIAIPVSVSSKNIFFDR